MSEGTAGRGDIGLDRAVRGNDWRSLEPGELGRWSPTERVTVVLPCYMGQAELELTFAALANQTYPSHLLEAVVVDDGSTPPITLPAGASFTASVVAQERDGFGLARARNLGAERASGEILVFLDCDMIPEPQLVEAHARWHHVEDRVLTVGFRNHADFDGITAEDVGGATNLAWLIGQRRRRVTSPQWIEFHMTRTRNLTTSDTDLFRVASGGNLGIRREFFQTVGGCDPSFRQWGAEDIEFGYRAFNWGGVLVPERQALAWHQGAGAAPDPAEETSLVEQRDRLSHLVAERGFRQWAPGRSFEVPFVTVAVNVAELTFDEASEQIDGVLASAFHDLVVGLWVPERHPERVRLERQYGPDHRVLLTGDLLDEVPHAPVRLEIPPRARLLPTAVGSLIKGLEGNGLVRVDLQEFGEVRLALTPALRRAEHAGARDIWSAAGDLFGERSMSAAAARVRIAANIFAGPRRPSRLRTTSGSQGRYNLNPMWSPPDPGSSASAPWKPVNPPLAVLTGKVMRKVARIRTPGDAVTVARWAVRGLGNVARRARRVRQNRRADRRAARRAAKTSLTTMKVPGWVRVAGGGDHLPGAHTFRIKDEGVELVVAAAAAESGRRRSKDVPFLRVGLSSGISESPPFDHRRFNPGGYRPVAHGAAIETAPDLGSPEDRIQTARETLAVSIDRVDGPASAARLFEFAASGVPVVLDRADGADRWLGKSLATAVSKADRDRLVDPTERERVSVTQRRAALLSHSLPARLRQLRCAAGLPVLPEPSISVVVATNRPAMVDRVLRIVALQDHPNLELVLALHGDGFPAADPVAPNGLTLTVLRFPAEVVFGHVLNAASAAVSGEWVAKMDDDDWYGTEHLTDLLLAASYSGADLVGKGSEFVYLEEADLTVRRDLGNNEVASRTLAGGTLLVRAEMLREVSGWRGLSRGVDLALIDDVTGAGGQIWRTHPFGYLLRRTGGEHTWKVNERYFLRHADQQWDGLATGGVGVVSDPVVP